MAHKRESREGSAERRGDRQAEPAAESPEAKRARRDLSGTVLGDFELMRRLGSGGMGDVYLARQISLKRSVALKVLREDLTADETARKRFVVEAEASAKLTHGSIVQVYAMSAHDGIHFIVLEYVPGMNLRDFVVKKGPVSVPFAVRVLERVAGALHHAGSAGIVHRDIKPDNILLTRQGDVKVTDFGLARLRAESAVHLTQTGVTMGTPLYMSPEQVEGRSIDERSDLYSLGVTGYYMLAGHPPYRGKTALAVAVQHIQGTAEPLDKLRPELPAALCQVVNKLMERDPDRRYQTARHLLRDLEKIRVELGSSDPAPLTQREPDPPAKPASRRSWTRAFRPETMRRYLIWWFIATIVVGLAAGAGYGWYRRAPQLVPDLAVPPTELPASGWEQVEKQKSAELQFKYATWAGQHGDEEAAWLAVIHHWPSEPDWVLPAQIQLGKHYLDQRQLDRAERHFDEMAQAPDERTRLAGIIGQSAVLSLRDDPQRSQVKLWEAIKDSSIGSDPRSLGDRVAVGLVLWTLERNYRNLGADWDPEIRTWATRRLQRFRPQPGRPEAPPGAAPGSGSVP